MCQVSKKSGCDTASHFLPGGTLPLPSGKPERICPCCSYGEGIITTDPLIAWCQMQARSQSSRNGTQAGKSEQPQAQNSSTSQPAAAGGSAGELSGGSNDSGGSKKPLVDVRPWLIQFSELRFLRPIGKCPLLRSAMHAVGRLPYAMWQRWHHAQSHCWLVPSAFTAAHGVHFCRPLIAAGSGSFGSVYLAVWNSVEVAVKVRWLCCVTPHCGMMRQSAGDGQFEAVVARSAPLVSVALSALHCSPTHAA